MIFGSVGTVSSSWNPPIPMSGLLEWYEPGNTAGIVIGNPEDPIDKMVNLVGGTLKYQQLGTSQFGSDLLGATTLTSNGDSEILNSWRNLSDWSVLNPYTIIIISKYTGEGSSLNTFVDLNDPVMFNFGNGDNSINVCKVNGNTISAGSSSDTLWAMYTLSGSIAAKMNFYRNGNSTPIAGPVNFQFLPNGTLIFPDIDGSSSVGAILLYDRIITKDERSSIFQHYKKQFPLLDT